MDGIKTGGGEHSPMMKPSSSRRWRWKMRPGGRLPVPRRCRAPLLGSLPLVGFAVCGALAVTTRSGACHPLGWAPLTLAVAAFLCSTAVSTAASVDVARSLSLSAPFLPGVLLFVVLAAHASGPEDVRRLYLVLSATGLGLAVLLLLRAAWSPPDGIDLFALVPRLGIPILVVPNDVTVLAVLAPLSLLLCHEPRGTVGLIAALSLLLSAGAICAYRSRTAILTMAIALICAAALSRYYRQRAFRATAATAALLLALLALLTSST